MSTDQHFAVVSLWFRPAGSRDIGPVREGYVMALIDPNAGSWVDALRETYSGVARTVSIQGKTWVRLQGRTSADGWLMAQAGTAPEDPKNLDSMEPLLLPMGEKARVWWTDDEALFDEVLRRADEDDDHIDPLHLPSARLLLDVNQPLPQAVERRLEELGETLEQFQQDPDEAFPEVLMRSVDGSETRAIVLEDEALEIALDLAHGLLEAAGLVADVLPDQALVNVINDIVSGPPPLDEIVAKHARVCGGDYRALRSDFGIMLEQGGRLADDNGRELKKLFGRAVEELRAHPYENRDDRFSVILRASILGNAEQFIAKLYKPGSKQSAERLLQIVQGKAKPAEGDFAEFAMDQLRKWVHEVTKVQGHASKAADLIAQTTQWTADVLNAAVAADKQVVRSTVVLEQGMDVSVRIILALDGQVVEAGVRVYTERVSVETVTTPTNVNVYQVEEAARFTAAAKVLGRISDLIKVANGLALLDKVLSGEEVTMLELLGDIAGTVEGFETLYRLRVGASATALGTILGEVSGVLGVAIGLQKSWDHLQAGKSTAVLAEAAGVGATIMALTLRFAVRPAPPQALLLLAAAGAAGAVVAELVYSDQEKVLEAYNPRAEGSGPFGDARHKGRSGRTKLDALEIDERTRIRIEGLKS